MNCCTYCGAKFDGTSNFCTICGEKIDAGEKSVSENSVSTMPMPFDNHTVTNKDTVNVKSNSILTKHRKLVIGIILMVAVITLVLLLIFTVFLKAPQIEQPLTVAELLDLGEKFLLELDYEQALVQFLAVIEVEPKNERAYLGAFDAYFGLDDKDSAIEILQEGFDRTGNEEIRRMLDEIFAQRDSTTTDAIIPMPDSTPWPVEIDTGLLQAQVGDIIKFGRYEWRVLDVQDRKMLVISEYVLNEPMPYHSEWSNVIWANSNIRTYLNGEFYNSFSDIDKTFIIQAQVTNDNNQWFGTDGGIDTQDYIFLLCLDEVVRYFGDSGQLANRPNNDTWNIFDEYNDARIAYTENGEIAWWWLRSPGSSTDDAACVSSTGDLYVSGHPVGGSGGLTADGYSVADTGGVRPAMWINLE